MRRTARRRSATWAVVVPATVSLTILGCSSGTTADNQQATPVELACNGDMAGIGIEVAAGTPGGGQPEDALETFRSSATVAGFEIPRDATAVVSQSHGREVGVFSRAGVPFVQVELTDTPDGWFVTGASKCEGHS